MSASTPFAAAVAFVALLAATDAAVAQKPASLPGNYPARPVKVIISAAPGGGTDILGRLVFGKLGELWGTPFNPENLASGIGGIVALDNVVKSAPDGYTLLVTTGSTYLNSAFTNTGSYDVRKALTPIAQFTVAALLVGAHPGQPYANLRDFIAYAKKRPDELTYGVGGLGSSSHLAGALMAQMGGFQMTVVPYKGAGQSVVDAIAGRIQLVIGSITALAPYVRSGKLRNLGVTSAARMPSVPDFPSLAESGLPGFDYAGWFGTVAPAGIPQPIASALNQDIQRVIDSPEVRKALLAGGSDPMTGSQEQFRATIQNSLEKTELVLKATGIKLGD